MSDGNSGDDAPEVEGVDPRFIERIARPLRARERLPGDFEMRVMAAAHAAAEREPRVSAASPGSRGWWRRKRTIAVSPVAGVAIAAGLMGMTLLGDIAMRSVHQEAGVRASSVRSASPPSAPAIDTVHLVRFIFIDPRAQSIALVGDFNGWQKGMTQFERAPNGQAWVISVPLSPGRHEYAFVVKDRGGEHWVADPTAPTRSDEFGTESSVVEVGADAAHRAADAG